MNINDRTGCSKNTAFPETWKNGDLTASLSVYIYMYVCIYIYMYVYIYYVYVYIDHFCGARRFFRKSSGCA